MSFEELKNQIFDGYTCFLGTNPNDPTSDTCSNAAFLFFAYVIINFFCEFSNIYNAHVFITL